MHSHNAQQCYRTMQGVTQRKMTIAMRPSTKKATSNEVTLKTISITFIEVRYSQSLHNKSLPHQGYQMHFCNSDSGSLIHRL